MRHAGFLLMALVAGSTLSFRPLGAQAVASQPSPQIVTTASGEAAATPDRAMITFAVEVRRPTAAAAGAENSRRQKAVLDALKGKGIPSERITTTGYSVLPEERWDKGVRTVLGYVARNGVQVDVHQIDQVGPLIDAALAAGANNVGGLRFYSSRLEELRREALHQAVQRARLDAESMAKAAGGSLGDAIEITSLESGMPGPLFAGAEQRAMAADAAAATPIEVGEQRIRAMVTARWQFISGRR